MIKHVITSWKILDISIHFHMIIKSSTNHPNQHQCLQQPHVFFFSRECLSCFHYCIWYYDFMISSITIITCCRAASAGLVLSQPAEMRAVSGAEFQSADGSTSSEDHDPLLQRQHHRPPPQPLPHHPQPPPHTPQPIDPCPQPGHTQGKQTSRGWWRGCNLSECRRMSFFWCLIVCVWSDLACPL